MEEITFNYNYPQFKRNNYKIFSCIYKLSILLLFLIFIIVFVTISLILGNHIIKLIEDTDELVKNKFPNELNYLHDVVNDNNEKIKKIEADIVLNLNSLSKFLTISNKFIVSYDKYFDNKEFLNKIVSITNDINNATNNDKLIKIENDLHIIASALNKLVFNNTVN